MDCEQQQRQQRDRDRNDLPNVKAPPSPTDTDLLATQNETTKKEVSLEDGAEAEGFGGLASPSVKQKPRVFRRNHTEVVTRFTAIAGEQGCI